MKQNISVKINGTTETVELDMEYRESMQEAKVEALEYLISKDAHKTEDLTELSQEGGTSIYIHLVGTIIGSYVVFDDQYQEIDVYSKSDLEDLVSDYEVVL